MNAIIISLSFFIAAIHSFPDDGVQNSEVCRRFITYSEKQRLLVGFTEEVTDAFNIVDCAGKCARRMDYKCRSGMFYSGATTNNCVLNTESRKTKPEGYEKTDDLVEYFEPCPNRFRP